MLKIDFTFFLNSDEVSGTSIQPPPTNKRRLRGAAALSSVTPAPSSTSLIVCSATTTTTASSSERFTKVPEPIHSSASAQNSLPSGIYCSYKYILLG